MRIPSEQSIRDRAYQLWDQDGRPDGRSIDYWLQAARELEEEEVARSAKADAVLTPAAAVNAAEFRERTRQPNRGKRRVKEVGVPNGAGSRQAEKAAAMPQPVRNAP